MWSYKMNRLNRLFSDQFYDGLGGVRLPFRAEYSP